MYVYVGLASSGETSVYHEGVPAVKLSPLGQ